MEIQFISTTSNKLSDLPIINGQFITLQDADGSYYDVGGSRKVITGFRLVSSLPSTGQSGIIYGVTNADGHVDVSVWDSSTASYKQLSGYKATASSLGLVKPDGKTITINSNGVISFKSAPSTKVTYNNSTSGLAATNVQTAVDEVSATASTALSIAQSTTAVIAAMETRLQAVEAVANIALTT